MVDSVLWYIGKPVSQHTMYSPVYIMLCITLCVCSPSHPYLVSSLFTPSLYSLFFNSLKFLFSCITLESDNVFSSSVVKTEAGQTSVPMPLEWRSLYKVSQVPRISRNSNSDLSRNLGALAFFSSKYLCKPAKI